jgi:putative membrane protein (TIGR04086 family)
MEDIWFMQLYTNKEKIQNILSVVVGVLTGFALLTLLNLILLLFFLPGNRDNESKVNSNQFQLFAIVIMVISCLIAGFITAKISTRKTFIHVLLTGIIFLLIILGIANFKLEDLEPTDWVGLILVIPGTLLGGVNKIRKEAAHKI